MFCTFIINIRHSQSIRLASALTVLDYLFSNFSHFCYNPRNHVFFVVDFFLIYQITWSKMRGFKIPNKWKTVIHVEAMWNTHWTVSLIRNLRSIIFERCVWISGTNNKLDYSFCYRPSVFHITSKPFNVPIYFCINPYINVAHYKHIYIKHLNYYK